MCFRSLSPATSRNTASCSRKRNSVTVTILSHQNFDEATGDCLAACDTLSRVIMSTGKLESLCPLPWSLCCSTSRWFITQRKQGDGSPGTQQARRRVAAKLDPEKRYRELSDRLLDADTIANRAAVAAECLAVARFDEAERHYDHILSLPMGDDPNYALGKAKAQFGAKRPADAVATLDSLQ